MTSFLISIAIGMSPVAVPAPDYDIERMNFGISGWSGVTPDVENTEPDTDDTTLTPRAADTPSRDAERPDLTQNNSQEAPAAPQAPQTSVNQSMPSGGVLGIAGAYVGHSYVLGGTTPAGFDCSGYTSYVFNQVGISLPRSASQQQAYATPISNPAPGDLVFWGYPAYHVGIYAGNGMVYDAGNPSVGVTYRSVFSGVSGYGRVG